MPYVVHYHDTTIEQLTLAIEPPPELRDIGYGDGLHTRLTSGHPAPWHFDPCVHGYDFDNGRPQPCHACCDWYAQYARLLAAWQERRRQVVVALFAHPADAHAAVGKGNTGLKVTFIATEEEKRNWRRREQERFRSGEYVPVPWAYFERHIDPPRFPHLSLTHKGLIAYTKSEEHGVQDRQTRIRPGRYLELFFPDVPKAQRDEWTQQVQGTALDLQLARTPEEIRRVYSGGPNSCMSHPTSTYHWACNGIHPVEVYGHSDLAVAYYGDIDHASARAICWPARKLYGRIYGSETLRHLLEREGYQAGSMIGAKIRAIESDIRGIYIMPYVDGIDGASVKRIDGEKWIVLDNQGYLETRNTHGLSAAGADDDDDDDDDELVWECPHCGSVYYGEPGGTLYYRHASTTVCESCIDDAAWCGRCRRHWDSNLVETDRDGNYICPECIEWLDVSTCCVCSAEWREELLCEYRDAYVAGAICQNCERDYTYCVDCDRAIPRAGIPAGRTGWRFTRHHCARDARVLRTLHTSTAQPERIF